MAALLVSNYGCFAFLAIFQVSIFEAVCGSPIRTDGGKMKKGIKKIGVLFVCVIIIGIFASRY